MRPRARRDYLYIVAIASVRSGAECRPSPPSTHQLLQQTQSHRRRRSPCHRLRVRHINIGRHHAGALTRKGDADCPTDPKATTGDDGRLVFQASLDVVAVISAPPLDSYSPQFLEPCRKMIRRTGSLAPVHSRRNIFQILNFRRTAINLLTAGGFYRLECIICCTAQTASGHKESFRATSATGSFILFTVLQAGLGESPFTTRKRPSSSDHCFLKY